MTSVPTPTPTPTDLQGGHIRLLTDRTCRWCKEAVPAGTVAYLMWSEEWAFEQVYHPGTCLYHAQIWVWVTHLPQLRPLPSAQMFRESTL